MVAALRERRGIAFDPEDNAMTTGAFGALAIALTAVCDPGDAVIFISPPWFFYETLIAATGATPVRVPVNPATFDLDPDATAALSSRTRATIVNSPDNPTGKIYPPATLARLGDASARNGRAAYLLSDEAYSRIVYGGRT